MQATLKSNTGIPQVRTYQHTNILLAALNWLAKRDGQYRQARKLRELPEARLIDMSLSRDDANKAFYRGHANLAADQQSIILGNAW